MQDADTKPTLSDAELQQLHEYETAPTPLYRSRVVFDSRPPDPSDLSDEPTLIRRVRPSEEPTGPVACSRRSDLDEPPIDWGDP